MKEPSKFLNTPLKLVILLSLIVTVSEIFIMLLIESRRDHPTFNFSGFAWMLIDSVVLAVIVSAAIYFLLFRTMVDQQAELERQLDELCRFQKMTVGRELRMKELAEENAALRQQLAAAQPGETKS